MALSRDEPAMRMPPGDSNAHRPDLKPAVVARLVSPDGGVPVVRQRWDGNTSDPRGFPARAAAFMRAFKATPSPRERVAAANRYGEANAAHLAPWAVIPRMPAPLTWGSQVMSHALQQATWPPGEDATRDPPREWGHEGMAPRGLGGSSRAALERAEATRPHATPRAGAARPPPLGHRPAHRVGAPDAAHAALPAWSPLR